MKILLVAILLVTPACGASIAQQPPISVTDQRASAADAVVVRLGELQRAIVDAAGAGAIPLADARRLVTLISGDKNSTPPATGIVDALQAVPISNTATARSLWSAAKPSLFAVPSLAHWVPTIDQLLEALP